MSTYFTEQHAGIIAVKDLALAYLYTNEFTSKLVGWQHPEDCLEKTDYDLPCDASRFAHYFREQDKKVILSKKPLITLDIQHYKLGWKTFITSKTLINNSDHIGASLMLRGIDISYTILARYYNGLFKQDSKKFFGTHTQGATYILNSDHCPLALTEKQEVCLFFLIRGKTIKEIAAILELSPRTVEDHIEALKNKLRCQTKQDLIEKAISTGFLYYFPEGCNKVI